MVRKSKRFDNGQRHGRHLRHLLSGKSILRFNILHNLCLLSNCSVLAHSHLHRRRRVHRQRLPERCAVHIGRPSGNDPRAVVRLHQGTRSRSALANIGRISGGETNDVVET